MSIFPLAALLTTPLEVMRASKIGDDDGTPIIGEPEPVVLPSGRAQTEVLVDYDPPAARPNESGTARSTTNTVTVTMMPEDYAAIHDHDQLRFADAAGKIALWRIEKVTRCPGPWGVDHLEVSATHVSYV